MNGPEIMGALLTGYEPLTDLVAPQDMHGGALPEGATLPNLLITRVTRSNRTPLAGRSRRSAARVQVTVRAANYEQQVAIQKQVVAACDGGNCKAAGFPGASCISAGGGPDFCDQTAGIWMGSEDFSVSYPED